MKYVGCRYCFCIICFLLGYHKYIYLCEGCQPFNFDEYAAPIQADQRRIRAVDRALELPEGFGIGPK